MCHLLKQVFLYSLIFYFSHIFCHMKFVCVHVCVLITLIILMNGGQDFIKCFLSVFLFFLASGRVQICMVVIQCLSSTLMLYQVHFKH